jgi:hypothetical protein
MAYPGAVLAGSPPGGPAHAGPEVADRTGDEDVEQVMDLVAGQRDHGVGRGLAAALVAASTARKACESMARTIQRCQEVQRRTWYWSSPVRALLAWNDPSTVQRRPATRTKAAKALAWPRSSGTYQDPADRSRRAPAAARRERASLRDPGTGPRPPGRDLGPPADR